MSTRYSPDFKSLVARLLWMYGGNVALVSHLTGIPQRTLRDWRWDAASFPAAIRREQASQPPQNDPSTAAVDDFETLRQRLMEQALSLVSSVAQDAEDAPLHQRALALSRLIDRIMTLKSHVPSYDPDNRRIAYHEPTFERDFDDDWYAPDAPSQSEENLPPSEAPPPSGD